MTISLRYPTLLTLAVLLVACAHHESPPAADRIPFDQRLSHFQVLHNGAKFEELRAYFTRDATIQSPLTPRPVGVEKYLSALKAEPYHLAFSRTEVVYSLPTRAATRSDAVASAAGRFDLKERVTVDWRAEDGYWRISRILFPDWSPIVGTWRRSGLKDEGSIELRILPDGKYLVFLSTDASTPEFRGLYRVESNRIVFADTSSNDPHKLQTGEGTYIFLRTATGIDLRKVQDENSWRAERFEGPWAAPR
jgi:hypothetical protein